MIQMMADLRKRELIFERIERIVLRMEPGACYFHYFYFIISFIIDLFYVFIKELFEFYQYS